jgi:hypothetical protein
MQDHTFCNDCKQNIPKRDTTRKDYIDRYCRTCTLERQVYELKKMCASMKTEIAALKAKKQDASATDIDAAAEQLRDSGYEELADLYVHQQRRRLTPNKRSKWDSVVPRRIFK